MQHSWASISHELEYKKKYEIPSMLQRKLFRLASFIEIADEEFINVRNQHNEIVEKIFRGKVEGNDLDQVTLEELNSLTLKNYIKESPHTELIEREAKRAGFTIIPIRADYKDDKYIAEIINHCNYLNIKTISELDKVLENLSEKYFALFKAQKEASKGKWTSNATFLMLLLIIYLNIKNIKDVSFLKQEGWGTTTAERVLYVFRKRDFQ